MQLKNKIGMKDLDKMVPGWSFLLFQNFLWVWLICNYLLWISPSVLGWIVSTQNTYVEALMHSTQNVTAFEGKVFKEVIELQRGHWGVS